MRQSHKLFTFFLPIILAFTSALPCIEKNSPSRSPVHTKLAISINHYHSTFTSSATKPTTMELKRGSGGRIEDAFAAAKARNEAAFVSFVTAGYPSAQGAY